MKQSPTDHATNIGRRATINSRGTPRLDGRTGRIVAIEKHNGRLYYRVNEIAGLPTGSLRLYPVEALVIE